MKKIVFGIGVITLFGLLFSACKKQEFDSDTQSATDYAYLRMGFNTTLPLANNITVNEEGVKAMEVYTCATVTHISGDTTNWPLNGDTLVYTVDYGTIGCTDHDGRFKQGLVTVYFYDDFAVQGGTIKMIPTDYYVDFVKYSGTITMTNNGNHVFTTVVSNGVCSTNNWTITYSGTTVFTWLSGHTTPADPTDDSYTITENGSGVNRNGKSFTIATTAPLHKDSGCKWIKSGTVEITPAGLMTRTIDFGGGTCDDDATMTIDGRVFEFSMQ